MWLIQRFYILILDESITMFILISCWALFINQNVSTSFLLLSDFEVAFKALFVI